MTAVESTPRVPVRTAGGTLVGMPALTRRHSRLGSQCSTTLRSIYSADELAPPSDAFHPERWSCPPPVGSDPIFPCPDPVEDDDAVFARSSGPLPAGERTMPSVGAIAPSTEATGDAPAPPSETAGDTLAPLAEPVGEPLLPPAEAAGETPAPMADALAESVDAPTLRKAPTETEPVTLAYRAVEDPPDNRLLLASALASVLVVAAGTAAALLWL